jgi:hypothetical protein
LAERCADIPEHRVRPEDEAPELSWKRPRTTESYDNRFWIPSIAAFENRWSLVLDRLESRAPDPALVAE